MLDLANASRMRGEVLMGWELESLRAGRPICAAAAADEPKSAIRGEAAALLPGLAVRPSGGIMP